MNKNKYFITEKTYTKTTCPKCQGKKTTLRVFRKMEFVEDCSQCLGKGVVLCVVSNEVPLIEVLKKLSLLK
jgi:DnaJ-class molecular chaperone